MVLMDVVETCRNSICSKISKITRRDSACYSTHSSRLGNLEQRGAKNRVYSRPVRVIHRGSGIPLAIKPQRLLCLGEILVVLENEMSPYRSGIYHPADLWIDHTRDFGSDSDL